MEFKLTSKRQYSHRDKDGRSRNHLSFYLNGVLILRQKIPFDTNLELGFDRMTAIYDVYLLNGKIYQKRRKTYGCSHPDNGRFEVREVSFPLSKKVLSQFDIPRDCRIELS